MHQNDQIKKISRKFNKLETLAWIRKIGHQAHLEEKDILPLTQIIYTTSSSEVKAAACIVLGSANSAQAEVINALNHALFDDSPFVREYAAAALVNHGSSASVAISQLIHLLRDSAPQVRANAAWALGNIGNSSSIIIESVCDCLSDPESLVRWRAVNTLKQLDVISIRIVLSLENALLDQSHMVAEAAKDAFLALQKRNLCQLPTSLVA